jgi:hypothetical protein
LEVKELNALLTPYISPETTRWPLTLTELRQRLQPGQRLVLTRGARVRGEQIVVVQPKTLEILKVQSYEVKLQELGQAGPAWLPLPRGGQHANGVTWFSTPDGYEFHCPSAVFQYRLEELA